MHLTEDEEEIIASNLPEDFFKDYPTELPMQFAPHLNPEEIAKAKSVTKKFLQSLNLPNMQPVWKEMYQRDFAHRKVKQKAGFDWEIEYRAAYHEDYDYDPTKLPKEKRKLFSLVKKGDVKELEDLFVKNLLSLKDLDLEDKHGTALLEWAISKNYQPILDFFYKVACKHYALDEDSIDVTEHDASGRTIAHWASLCNQSKETLELLMSKGANLNALTFNGLTPLTLAIIKNQIGVIENLIAAGANINAGSPVGATALLFAAEHKRPQALEILLKKGANTSIALHTESTYHNHFNVVKNDTPLHAAVKSGDIELVKILLDHGTPVDQLSNFRTPLIEAAKAGYADIAELLIQRGANINARSESGATALLFAVEHKHKEVFDALLKHRADTSIPLRQNQTYHNSYNVQADDTPLHAAITNGQIDFVDALLDHHVNLNTLNGSRFNALQYAAVLNQQEIVELLLTHPHHANIDTRTTGGGATPLLLATEKGHKSVVNVLLKHHANVNLGLLRSNNYHKKMNVTVGDTPLHAAAKLGYASILRMLLRNNADLEQLNNNHKMASEVAKKDTKYASELTLLTMHKKASRLDNNYRKSFSLFGHKLFEYGCTGAELKATTTTLKDIVFDGADKSTLNDHEKTLNSWELSDMVRSLKIR